MSIKSDYLMDMVARFCDAVLRGIDAMNHVKAERAAAKAQAAKAE